MDYAEASYFDGYHFKHIAAWLDEKRLKDIRKRNQVYAERAIRERRSGSRILAIVK